MATLNISIHPWPKTPEYRVRKKLQHSKNQRARADLYREMRGESGNKRATEWHTTLYALSHGTL